jgi:electron transfer flavoprotein alpha subunit
MAGIWILAETYLQVRELLPVGRMMADKMGTDVTVLLRQSENIRDCFSIGADRLYVLPPLPKDQSFDAYLPTIVTAAKEDAPDHILIPASARGKDMAARLAVQLDTGLCSGCIGIHYDDAGKRVEMERLAYGGAAVQKVTCSTRPFIATFPAGIFPPAASTEPREGTVKELPMPPLAAVKVLEKKEKERTGRDISGAKIVICVGRGLQNKEDIALARELADTLNGEIGCTRPISEELHWLPEDLCIGLSGIQVKPDLYIGLGVSGQIQHITGIRNAKVIGAVNQDENAPIFAASDLGIVGDLYDVVPKLIAELKKR